LIKHLSSHWREDFVEKNNLARTSVKTKTKKESASSYFEKQSTVL